MRRVYNSLFILLRVTAYYLRVKGNAKVKSKRVIGAFLYNEHKNAATIIVKLVHSNIWHDEINCLKMSVPVKNSSPLLFLRPFLEENYVMGVSGSSCVHECSKKPYNIIVRSLRSLV